MSERILKASTLAGRILLEKGAETIRVEETVVHILNSFDVEDASVFATPTGLFLSFEKEEKTYSRVLRIKSDALDLEKINAVNAISRACKNNELTVDEVYDRLKIIDKQQGYPLFIRYMASGFVAMSFTYLFKGSIMDGICAFLIGIVIQALILMFDKKGINAIVKITFISFILTIFALVFQYIGFADSKDKMIMGSIMLLVPGVAITNAIRDCVSGDLLSGITRAIEACLIAVALALGAGVAIQLWIAYIGGIML